MPYADPDQQREYQRLWVQRRRDDWFLNNGPCVDCGTWESLELDHVDRTLKISHKIWTWSDARRLPELAKCVARCEPCHAKKSGSECLRGEDNPRSTASRDQVLEIRRRVGSGESQAVVAHSLGFSTGYVHDIVRFRTRRYEI